MRNLCTLFLSMMLVIPAAAFAVDDKVNLNTAQVPELEKELQGVNEQLAKNIVQYRNKHGEFTSIDQLELVEGIGYDVLNINRHDIVIK